MATPPSARHREVPCSSLILFVTGTFTITWGIVGSYILFPETAAALFGVISGGHPLYFLATWAPAIAGVTVVVAYTGVAGLRAFLSRLFIWRCAPVWWIFILLGLPVVFIAGSLLKGGPALAPLPPGGAAPMLALMGMMLLLGPVEELGWRGVAQPLLQRYMAPFWAGVLIGSAWGLWHLPAFFLAGVVYEGWSFLPFFIGNVTLAILVTPIFNSARGSLLLPVLFHWQLINPLWPDAQPWDTWILVGIAVVIAYWKSDALFRRDDAVTQVIPASERVALPAAR